MQIWYVRVIGEGWIKGYYVPHESCGGAASLAIERAREDHPTGTMEAYPSCARSWEQAWLAKRDELVKPGWVGQ